MIDFHRHDFFPIKKKIYIKDLLLLINDILIESNIKNNFEINDISSLDYPRENSIIFLNGEKNITRFKKDNICILTNDSSNLNYDYNNIIITKNLEAAYSLLLNNLFFHEDNYHYSDEFNYVNGSYFSKSCNIHHSAEIGRNCVIGRGVEIKENVIIKNNVTIKNTILSNNVVISDNSVLGSTGFGFGYSNRGASNISPQIGIVFIDSNSHIGSNCCIDRGKIDMTYIGKNCMIDNLVHIAHNVYISDNACIAAQTGISGSVKIGSNVTVGGQAGFAGHIDIGNNVTVAAKSGVTKNIKDNSTVAGFPAIDIKIWKKKIIKERNND